MSRDLRRPLRALNAARVVAVSTLLLASFLIEILFAPERPLTPLYWLAGAVYGTVLLYVFLERWLGDSALLGAIQIGADVAIVAAFVIASGGSVSPISFLFVVPVMIGAAVFGLRGGVSTATFAWSMYALVLIWEGLRDPAAVPPGRALYAALSHLVGFVALGALGGVLADRLRLASVELGKRESDLAALRALHQQIVESINTGILTTDREGRISFVNRAGRAILGESSESVVERTLQDVLGLPLELLRDAERAGDRRRNRFERTWHRPSDGEDLFLGFALSTLRGGDDVTLGWLLVFQDLTEIASLEQQVKTRERMAALGEMAAGMAHELRNPLAAISGCVQVLQEGRAGDQSA
ncbi:MAG: PAS domain S-box protein, partial [Acidobacteria bacterium]|nr:PAS domain S-box protein [Acidobacteriota bacterium]